MRYKYWIGGLLSILLCGCSSDEPKQLTQDKWQIEYHASGLSIEPECLNGFLQWCENNEKIMAYSIPSRDVPSFSYESTTIIKWSEYVDSEDEAKLKVRVFNTTIGKDDNTTFGALYRKYDPLFTGPWRVVFVEEFSFMHNNSECFNNWYNENLPNLQKASFMVSYPDYHWEYPSPQTAFDFYNKSIVGNLQWTVDIPKASEGDIQQMVRQFQSFSITGKNKNQYDTFVADYTPITPSKTFP